MEFIKYEKWGAYHWIEYERGSLYTKHANKVINWITEKHVLDIGCGDGLITYLLNAEGIDDNELAIQLAQKKGVKARVGNVYSLSGTYEAVYLGDVLEHLERPEDALEQIASITDTLYLVTPPRKKKLRPHHFHEWTPDELMEYMENQGWRQVGDIEVTNDRMYGKFKKQ